MDLNSSIFLCNRKFTKRPASLKWPAPFEFAALPTVPAVAQLVIKTSTSAAYQLSVQRWFWRYLPRTRLHHRHIQISRFYKNMTEVLITAFLILSFTRSRNLECVRVFCYSSLSSFDSWSYQLVCWSTQGQSLIVTLPAVDAAKSYSPTCTPSHDMRPASSWRSHLTHRRLSLVSPRLRHERRRQSVLPGRFLGELS